MPELEVREPAVISHDLIRKCIVPPRALDGSFLKPEKAEEKKAEMTSEHIVEVCLSFQNVLKLDNLHGLQNLVKLQLDNNIISSIENIAHLTSLEWLDLSFNNIAKIEGLDTLTRITDLSLFNNQIESIEGLSSLQALNVFSIGNNEVKKIDFMCAELRKFPNLRLLNAHGNPIQRDNSEYRSFIIAHVPGLKYLDYRLIEAADHKAAREQFIEEISVIEETREREKEEVKKKKLVEERAKEQAACYLDGVESLLADMFKEDADNGKLIHLPFWDEKKEETAQKLNPDTEVFIQKVLEAHNSKIKERARYQKALGKSQQLCQETAISIISSFGKAKKKLWATVQSMETGDALAELDNLINANISMQNDLMEIELHQCEEEEQLLSEFERNYLELMTENTEAVSGHFTGFRDCQKAFNESILSMTQQELERFAAGDGGDEALTEEQREVLKEKEPLLAAIQASHDMHLSKIDAKEDAMTQQQTRAFNKMIAGDKETAAQRNRSRISEIAALIEKNDGELRQYRDIVVADDA